MKSLRHKEFIANMARYKAEGIWENYRKRHANDPQLPAMGDATHYVVCNLAAIVDLSSLQSMREGLCAKFKAQSVNGSLNHKHNAPKADLIRIMKASGLKWFELDGCPYIHWSENP